MAPGDRHRGSDDRDSRRAAAHSKSEFRVLWEVGKAMDIGHKIGCVQVESNVCDAHLRGGASRVNFNGQEN